MEHRKYHEFARLVQLAVQSRDAAVRLQDEFRRKIPQRDDERRVYRARLLPQKRRAHFDFGGHGVAVSGGSAFQHVRNIDVFAAQTRVRKQFVEVFARCAHKRHALQVLVLSRRFAHYEHARLRITGAEHHMRAAFGKRACTTRLGLRLQRLQRNVRSFHDAPFAGTARLCLFAR